MPDGTSLALGCAIIVLTIGGIVALFVADARIGRRIAFHPTAHARETLGRLETRFVALLGPHRVTRSADRVRVELWVWLRLAVYRQRTRFIEFQASTAGLSVRALMGFAPPPALSAHDLEAVVTECLQASGKEIVGRRTAAKADPSDGAADAGAD